LDLLSGSPTAACTTQGDEGLAAQANKRPANRKPATQPQSKPSVADDVVNAAISSAKINKPVKIFTSWASYSRGD